MSDDAPPTEPEEGAPVWVMTFADLMSLLMCFFVLLLAFSEMDALKFKQISGSMQFAFGVQRDIKAKEIPKGTSIVAKEFSPGKPDPSALTEVRQHTTDEKQRFLEIENEGESSLQTNNAAESGQGDSEEDREGGPDSAAEVIFKEVLVQLEADASDLEAAFKEEIESGLIEIETKQERIIIRIQEEGSFPSGSAVVKGGFKPVMQKLGAMLTDINGQIIVAGHTDDVPIATARFRSNWELSAARAVSVLHHLSSTNLDIGQSRFVIEGHADADPMVANDTTENRAKNRRVEVIIVQSAEDLEHNRRVLGVGGEDGESGDANAESGASVSVEQEATPGLSVEPVSDTTPG